VKIFSETSANMVLEHPKPFTRGWFRHYQAAKQIPDFLIKPTTHKYMATSIPRPQICWPFVPSSEMAIQLGVSAETLKDWRANNVLKRGIYWTIFPHIQSRVYWNRDLVRDWFVNGNSQGHQKALEKYLNSLPSSDRYPVDGAYATKP
jgi:hypothetical protein